jgi:four helix bundle protein
LTDTGANSSDFRQQLLWREAQEFAADLTLLVKNMHRDQASNIVGHRLLRAGGSIATNIAGGHGRFSMGAYRNHLSIARGSAFESKSWLDLLVRTEYLTTSDGERLIERCPEIEKNHSSDEVLAILREPQSARG